MIRLMPITQWLRAGAGRLLSSLVRPDRTIPHAQQRGHVESLRYVVASEACAEARLALVRGDIDTAHAHIQHAAGVCSNHPEVIEIQSRLALKRNDPTTAIALLERQPRPTARHRLLLQLARLQTGQTALAHLELQHWSHQPHFPVPARVLLAWLDFKLGRVDHARALLRQAPAHANDPDLLRLRILIELSAGNTISARRATAQLGLHHAGDALSHRFLASLDAPKAALGPQISIQMIEELSGQLASRPHLIATLLAAQRIKPCADRIELLRRAIGRLAEDAPDPLIVARAMAELASLAGDQDDARRWARRGLRHRPYCARLAMLLDDLGDAEPAQSGPLATLSILRQVADDHPDYSDVQARLIQRYHQRGLTTLATRRLRRWLLRRPHDRLALKTLKELAA